MQLRTIETDRPAPAGGSCASPFQHLLLSLLLVVVFGNSKTAQATGEYISQTCIDTMVQHAYEGLNVEDVLPDRVAAARRAAIDHAKIVASRLKKMAEGNSNQKYMLWKAGELESQIYLEEEGLLAADKQKNQKATNDLVGPFNTEIGRKRPDFGKLYQLRDQMREHDGAKGDELTDLVRNRSRDIGREVRYSFDTAMDAKAYGVASTELAYCKQNQDYFGVSVSEYGKMEARFQSHATLDDVLDFVRSSHARADSLTARLALAEAGELLRLAKLRLDGVRGTMIRIEWDKFDGRNQKLQRAVQRKEDSLIAVAHGILRDQGVVAAGAYLDTVVKARGVSNDKVGRLDYEILQTAMAQKKNTDTTLGKQYADLSTEAPAGPTVLDDLLSAARRKAQGRSDSLKALRAENGRLTQVEEVRRDQMRVARAGMLEREKGRTSYAQQRAQKILVDIYALIDESKRGDAADEFRHENDFLQKYLPRDDYEKLSRDVGGNK